MAQTLASQTAAKDRASVRDDLTFQPSPEISVGVELELQILDRESGDLTSGAVPLIKAAAEEGLSGVTAELMQSMIEVKTGVCRTTLEARDQLLPVLKRLSNIATSMGYDLAMAGTHPFHRTSTSAVSPDERYERIMDRLAWLTYQRVLFGLHIHVGVPSGDRAIAVTNLLVQYLPHVLALSASSPFWQGVDTGLASCRAALYRMLPHAGVPRFFRTWKEFRGFCQVMIDCKTIGSFKDIYWDIRPRPDFGTLEFRICDMPINLSTALGLVALTRCLVISSLRLLEERPQVMRGDMRRHWIAVENKWLATRYGLDGMYIRTPSGKRRQLRQEVADLVDRLLPVARESGEQGFLLALQPVESFESGAARQRRIYRETGAFKPVLDDLKQRLVDDLKNAPAPAA
jgi:carboxylate-amine ligase